MRARRLFAFISGALIAGCGQVEIGTCTGRRPSLSADVVPAAFQRCAGTGCHGYGGGQAAYDMLVNVPATRDTCGVGLLVDPGNVAGSYLINKLTGEGMCPNTTRMPEGDRLADAQIQTVVDWICSGAPNN